MSNKTCKFVFERYGHGRGRLLKDGVPLSDVVAFDFKVRVSNANTMVVEFLAGTFEIVDVPRPPTGEVDVTELDSGAVEAVRA